MSGGLNVFSRIECVNASLVTASNMQRDALVAFKMVAFVCYEQREERKQLNITSIVSNS